VHFTLNICVVWNISDGLIAFFSAQAYSFTFDKVFDHSASQEDVFIEISQLVQSALDGYKVHTCEFILY
jgi:kinesin family member C1